MHHLIPRTDTHHRRSAGLPLAARIALAVAAMLTLLMPVSYRAGTDQAHAHATFQLWIDAATGRSHHHHDDIGAQWRIEVVPAPALFVPAADALASIRETTDHNAHTHAHHSHGDTRDTVVIGDAPASEQPDTAQVVSTHMPMQLANVLVALGALIALLLAGTSRRPRWTHDRPLAGVSRPLDPPPPRLVPC